MMKNIKTLHLSLFSIIVLVACYHLGYVWNFQHFIFDDYYIFHKIENGNGKLLYVEPTEQFFLFVRPITYIYFSLLYHAFGNDGFWMKLIAIFVQSLLVFLFYLSLKEYEKLFNVRIASTVILLSLLFIGTTLDSFISVVWIANANELIAGVLYLLVLLVFGYYVNDTISSRTKYVVLINVLYLLSLGVKQTSAHLPLLLYLFTHYFKCYISESKRETVKVSLIIMTIVLLLFVIINVHVYYNSHLSQMSDTIYKKPFALIGTIIVSFIPLPGKIIYEYLLLHKTLAFFIAIALCSSAIYLFRQIQSNERNNIIVILLSIFIVFLPRIFAQSGERLNTIQILYITLVLCLSLRQYPKVVIAIIIISTSSNLFESVRVYNEITNGYQYNVHADRKLYDYKQKENNPIQYIVLRNVWTSTPYSYYYHVNGKFGNDTTLLMSGISIYGARSMFNLVTDVQLINDNGMITLSTKNATDYFNYTSTRYINIYGTKDADSRGMSMIAMKPIVHAPERVSYIVYSDSVWNRIR